MCLLYCSNDHWPSVEATFENIGSYTSITIVFYVGRSTIGKEIKLKYNCLPRISGLVQIVRCESSWNTIPFRLIVQHRYLGIIQHQSEYFKLYFKGEASQWTLAKRRNSKHEKQTEHSLMLDNETHLSFKGRYIETSSTLHRIAGQNPNK